MFIKRSSLRTILSYTLAIILTFIIPLSKMQSSYAQSFYAETVGHGKPLILIPGLMSDASIWEPITSKLAENYQVHSINIAGFGSTAKTDKPSLNRIKQELLQYIIDHSLTKPIVIGHSLGGFMAFWLASSAPDRIGPIISVDGLPFIGPVFTQSNTSTVESLAHQARVLKTQYSNMTPPQLEAQSRLRIHIQATATDAQEKIINMVKQSDPRTVADALYVLLTTDLREAISAIKHGILLIGASGGFNRPEDHQRIEQLYRQQLQANPHTHLIMNTKARHFIMLDEPDWLIQQISHFLGAVQ